MHSKLTQRVTLGFLVLQAYTRLLPHVNLSGPTTWAPAVYKALEIVKRNNGRYHILVIISDGQVNEGRWEEETRQAIVTASYFPLSIIMVRPLEPT
jgi:Mg-chelatase subunit ChlD